MRDSKDNKKKSPKKEMNLDEFLAEERFDEEDEDSVTDDTLEFLCLDDDVIGSYNSERKNARLTSKVSVSQYDEDSEEDEDFDDEYEDEDDEDEDYEDEDYEDEDYEDEDDEYEYDDDEEGVFVRFKRFLADMSTLDMVVAMLGIVVLAGVIVTGSLFVNAKTIEKQMEAFASVGEEVQGISVIGESGLIAVSESAKLSGMIDIEEDVEEPAEAEAKEEEENKKKEIEVTLNITSIQSDLKIKFVNKATGKLIGGVPFEVAVSNGSKSFDLRDDDKDGIIYQTGVEAGTYQVTVKPINDSGYEQYKLPAAATSVKVTDTIAYKKVDVADEVKSESEINAAKEDTAIQDMTEESALTDTVEWVESTKTTVDSNENYREINKDQIPDPATLSASVGFMKMVALTTMSGNDVIISDRDKLKDIAINATALTMKRGETATLGISGRYLSEASVIWSSVDNNVAGVSGGVVTANGIGSTTISATVAIGAASTTLSCSVTVAELEYVVGSINCPASLTVGAAGQASAATSPAGGTITWSSSDSNIVGIDATTGQMTAKAAGTVTITAQCGNSTATWSITVVKDIVGDTTTKLKDKNGNQVYVYRDGGYAEAVYADYYTADRFYLVEATYRYTGWQTLDGSVYYYDKDGNRVTGEQIIQGARYTFDSDGRLSAGSGTMGIDVSKWNGNIDWNAVKNSGVSYVIIRCGYRGSSTGVLVEDPKFRSNIKGAKAAGLKVGVYFFSQAVNEVEAVEEASMALSLVSGYGLNYPIFLDVESSGGRGDGVSKETRTAVCNAFCQTIQNSGYSAGVYANKTWFTEKINASSLTGYKIWLAQYAVSPTYTATRYDMWQYSSKGQVSGISGYVDMNISYLNY